MHIIDRYLLRLFLRVLVICFLSLSGLFVVIDTFGNLDEFLTYRDEHGELWGTLAAYYAPRILMFFDRTAHMIALMSSVFALTWMQKNNEMTALMAAGIPPTRLVKPLVIGVFAVSLLAAANREAAIPRFRNQLLRDAQDLSGENSQQLQPRYDNETDIYFGGRSTVAAERKIVEPHFRLPPELAAFGKEIAAAAAIYQPPGGGRPGGYLLRDVHRPTDLSARKSVLVEGRPVILSPADTPWLKADECFVASRLTFDQLCAASAWRQYSSTPELLAGLRNPSFDFGADVRVTIHARVVQPFLDMAMLFLGLPLVLSRHQRNIFVAAGFALLQVVGFFVVVLTCHALGSNYLISPALAAWLPLMVFGPLAYSVARPLWE